ncbi:MAG: DUF3566 domain-containing protein [Acidimicrobiales bacterium]
MPSESSETKVDASATDETVLSAAVLVDEEPLLEDDTDLDGEVDGFDEALLAPSMPEIDDMDDMDDPYLPPEQLVDPVLPSAAPLPVRNTSSPTWRDRRAANRLRARKVRRLVRHIEPWSMLKISLLFNFCLWIIFLVAGVLLWGAAVSSGTVDNIENFIEALFALDSFDFNADQIFRASALGGLVLVVAATGFNVLLAVLFNLISDLTGGVRITVVEEETARMFARPARRPRGSKVASQ